MFQQLHEWAYEHTFVFIGHGGQDPDLLEVVFDIDAHVTARPRHFIVLPNQPAIVSRYWGDQRVTLLDGTFLQFMQALDATRSGFSIIAPSVGGSHSVSRRFTKSGAAITNNCIEYLAGDAEYVVDSHATKSIEPKSFYLGYSQGWSAIEQGLDVRRSFADDILEDIFLIDDIRKRKPIQIALIKGYAGSGKSVALRRIAWSASHDYDRLCIYANDNAQFNIGAIQELIENCNERLYLFIDNAAERGPDVMRLIREIGEQGELLTLVLAARSHEWNSVAGDLQVSVQFEYEVPALGKREINELLALLDSNKALGRLAEKSKEQRFHAFEELAGRQLLVALHEATLGKRFEDILVDEFNSITPEIAQNIYLTICVLNRLNIPVRAGLISRVHGVPFSQFSNELFKPLEHVVYDSYDVRIRDNVYRARHPVIAEIVFDRILSDLDQRFLEYFRAVSSLSIDFTTDDQAFRKMVRGRALLDIFPNRHSNCEAIFDLATDMVGDDPFLMQQRALYEMHRSGGDLNKATSLLNSAIEKLPYYKPFKHTKAELLIRKSDSARTSLEREKFLTEAASLATSTKNDRDGQTHSHHTLAKINLRRLEAEISNETDFSDPHLQGIIQKIEKEITQGLLEKPGDSYLLGERAKLSRLLNDQPKVILSLEQAFNHNPKLGYLALQLSDCYSRGGDDKKALTVLETALNINRTDRDLNYRFGLLIDQTKGSQSDIAYYMKSAFVRGDRNFDAQIRYCKALYMSGSYKALVEELAEFRKAKKLPYLKKEEVYTTGQVHSGRVNGIRSSHIFVTDDKSEISILIPRSEVDEEQWRKLSNGSKVQYELGFTFQGLLGSKCKTL